jgi:cell fate regulator YaaT (PSP1 superfamily)
VTVSFAPLGQKGEYQVDTSRVPARPGLLVVVEGLRGLTLGMVISEPKALSGKGGGRIRKVVRPARASDLKSQEEAEGREPEAFRLALAQIRQRQLPWKLLRVLADGVAGRMTFCFAAEQRAETRDVAQALERALGLQIEMRQLGPRDIAKVLGGLGRCGRELCCSSWLPQYPESSIRMAKDQNLALSQDKTSGVCGKNLCCLAYEHAFYQERRKWLPKLGKRARTVEGLEGRVVGVDVLQQLFTLLDLDGRRHVLPAAAWEGNAGKVVPEAEVRRCSDDGHEGGGDGGGEGAPERDEPIGIGRKGRGGSPPGGPGRGGPRNGPSGGRNP